MKTILGCEQVNGSLPDIDWVATYSLMGMDVQYKGFTQQNYLFGIERSWVIPVVSGLTYERLMEGYGKLSVKKRYGVKYKDLIWHDRDPDLDGSYLIATPKSVEAHYRLEETEDKFNFKRWTAFDFIDRGFTHITFVERLLLGLGYFVTTKEFLDLENSTWCAGSRDHDDFIPSVAAKIDHVWDDWYSIHNDSFGSFRFVRLLYMKGLLRQPPPLKHPRRMILYNNIG